jgi:hypothetical protein
MKKQLLHLTFATAKALWFSFLLLAKAKAAKSRTKGILRHFMWRLAYNSLALRRGLARRGMELDTKCVMCHRLNEDGGHLFLKCKFLIPEAC